MPNLLDQAVDLKVQVQEAEQRLERLDGQITEKQSELKAISVATEHERRDVLHQAQQEAKGIMAEAERVRQQAQTTLAEVEAREQAVAWVKEEDQRLKAVERSLKQREEASAMAASNASAKLDLAQQKLQQVEARENTVAQHESLAQAPPAPVDDTVVRAQMVKSRKK